MKDHVARQMEKWAERFEAFSLRERMLVSGAVVVVMFLVWDTMVMSPEAMRQKRIVSEMHGINQQMEQVAVQIQALTAKLRGAEAQHLIARTKEIQALLSNLKQQEQNLTVEFIRPQQMAGVLRDMLGAESGLVLTKLESLGAAPLFPPPETEAGDKAPAKGNIYKHGMRVVFEGDYFKTLAYLRALEALPWRLYWDNVEYQVLEYPKARIAITVHTLSLDEGWIGV